MTGVLLVAVGAALGAPARYLTDRFVQARLGTALPWGTFAANMVGCLVLGVLAGATAEGLDPRVLTGVGVGFCGALSTYSTFAYETARLAETGPSWRPVANVAGSVTLGLLLAAVGWAWGTTLR